MKNGILTGITVIMFLLAMAAFVISIRSFREKGFLFHNAYIYASKQERERMEKKAYYRQSGIAFLLAGVVLLLLGFAMLYKSVWLSLAAMGIAVLVGVYAVASDIAMEKKKD